MGNAQWLLELLLVLMLSATLFYAVRLERALGVLKRDRAVLEALVQGFNESTRQAENGIERLRAASEGAGRQMARQTESAQRLRDDLAFLAERSDRLAERLESSIRSARMLGDGFAPAPQPSIPQPAALQTPAMAIALPPLSVAPQAATQPLAHARVEADYDITDGSVPVLRSQAERELLRALRARH